MTTLSIGDASKIYACGEHSRPTVHYVTYPSLQKFARELREFERALGERRDDEFWSFFVRRLRWFRFEMSAAPLGQTYRVQRFATAVNELSREVRIYEQAYPALGPLAKSLLSLADLLIGSSESPMATKLDELIQVMGIESTVLLLCEARLTEPTQELLRTYPRLTLLPVMAQSQARGRTCYERIIVLGARRWYPDHTFTAPRGRQINVLTYDWLGDRWQPSHQFATQARTEPTRGLEQREGAVEVEAEEMLPRIDLYHAFTLAGTHGPVTGSHEDVRAIGLQLSDGMGVYLDAEEGARALVLDVTESPGDEVQRVPVVEIEPGMFVLLRSGGGGDYIVEAADVILGARGEKLRRFQRGWKSRLRRQVKTNGMEAVVNLLRREGSGVASEQNVRNWMSYRGIKTQKLADFRAIMCVIGREDLTNRLWKYMTIINHAHRLAGNRIRRLLVEQVRKADLRELARKGRMDFELTGTGARGLTAYRIENIDRRAVQVPAHRLGHAFKTED